MTKTPYIDIHTHKATCRNNVIEVLNISPYEECTHMASCGLHPWNVDEKWKEAVTAVERRASESNIFFIGETGIDKLCGTDLHMQMEAMERQARTAERACKPMIIHCVKGYDELISIRKAVKAEQRWIIHGFRGKPQLVQQLLGLGFDISLGNKFNPETAKAIPSERLWIETDECTADISYIYKAVAEIKGMNIEELKDSIYERFCGMCTLKG